jgi:hypothetical protein
MPGRERANEIYLRLLSEKADEMLMRQDAANDFAEFFGHLGPAVVQQLLRDARLRRSQREIAGSTEAGDVNEWDFGT